MATIKRRTPDGIIFYLSGLYGDLYGFDAEWSQHLVFALDLAEYPAGHLVEFLTYGGIPRNELTVCVTESLER